jgi:hypothetical protein
MICNSHPDPDITIVFYDFHPHDLKLISLLSSPNNFICSIHCHYTHCILFNYKSTHISTRPEKYFKSTENKTKTFHVLSAPFHHQQHRFFFHTIAKSFRASGRADSLADHLHTSWES